MKAGVQLFSILLRKRSGDQAQSTGLQGQADSGAGEQVEPAS